MGALVVKVDLGGHGCGDNVEIGGDGDDGGGDDGGDDGGDGGDDGGDGGMKQSIQGRQRHV